MTLQSTKMMLPAGIVDLDRSNTKVMSLKTIMYDIAGSSVSALECGGSIISAISSQRTTQRRDNQHQIQHFRACYIDRNGYFGSFRATRSNKLSCAPAETKPKRKEHS
jgi:hypothetical protein